MSAGNGAAAAAVVEALAGVGAAAGAGAEGTVPAANVMTRPGWGLGLAARALARVTFFAELVDPFATRPGCAAADEHPVAKHGVNRAIGDCPSGVTA